METPVREKRAYLDKPQHVVVTPEVHAKLKELRRPGETMSGLATVILEDGLSKLERSTARERTLTG